MAPAVILVGCLLATISCLTTALNITTANPPFNATTNRPINATTNRPINATTNRPINTTTNRPINATTNRPINATTNRPINATTNRPINATTNRPMNSTANPPFNVTTNRPINATANPPINSNSTANPPINSTGINSTAPPKGSCANPNLCCSGINGSCRRLNCFCDVACLRFGDCCPDFKPTCLTVNNSSNGTEPNNTLTLTGTCSQPTLCCSGVNYNCFRGCFCDEACKQLNDCCPDINSTCIFNTTTAAPPYSTPAPPQDVLTLLTNLDVEVLAEEWSTEEERQDGLRQVGALLESYLRAYNTDIYSFEVTRIEPVSSSSSSSSSSSPCD